MVDRSLRMADATNSRSPYPTHFIPRGDNVTFGSLLSQIGLSSVTFVRPTQGVDTFGNISLPFCTLATL